MVDTFPTPPHYYSRVPPGLNPPHSDSAARGILPATLQFLAAAVPGIAPDKEGLSADRSTCFARTPRPFQAFAALLESPCCLPSTSMYGAPPRQAPTSTQTTGLCIAKARGTFTTATMWRRGTLMRSVLEDIQSICLRAVSPKPCSPPLSCPPPPPPPPAHIPPCQAARGPGEVLPEKEWLCRRTT